MVLVLFIAALLGAVLSIALCLVFAPAWSFFAAMVGGALGVTFASGWLAYVHRKRARTASPHTASSVKPDLVSPQ